MPPSVLRTMYKLNSRASIPVMRHKMGEHKEWTLLCRSQRKNDVGSDLERMKYWSVKGGNYVKIQKSMVLTSSGRKSPTIVGEGL